MTIGYTSNKVLADPTWVPEFNSGQTVYLDPDLKNHQEFPFDFSSDFASKLEKLDSQGIKYYIVAAQQGDEYLEEGTSLGEYNVDRLLAKWTAQPGFAQDYVLIFWVRKTNVVKGSVGVNVAAIARENGITKSILRSPGGLVIPSLKAYMPADPESAMLGIVEEIDQTIAQVKQAKLQAKENALALKKFWNRGLANIQKLLTVLLGLLPFSVGGLWYKRRSELQQALKDRLSEKLAAWEKMVDNGYLSRCFERTPVKPR